MKKSKKASIIVPCYNGEKYINRSLDGLLAQTYENLEILVVNDGSTDNSEKIVKKYLKKDKRIRLVSRKNGGIWKARIAGLENSTGYYIGFIDVDDDLHPEFVKKWLNLLKRMNQMWRYVLTRESTMTPRKF